MRSPWPVCWKAAPVVRGAMDPAATPGGTHTPPDRAHTPLTSAPEIAWEVLGLEDACGIVMVGCWYERRGKWLSWSRAG
eukprot:1746274-Rhodomonas_salina.1